MLQCCLNGARAAREHPALPLTPAALAEAAASTVAAGAEELHAHVRTAGGAESLVAADVAAVVLAIRDRCGAVPLGVSTGAWIEPDAGRRLGLIAGWTERPDYASVNLDEPAAGEVCETLLAKGVGVEAGIAEAGEVAVLLASAMHGRALRILIEPGGESAEEALATARAILAALDAAHVAVPRLLHGLGAGCWPVLELARELGLDTRIGLEDVLLRPDGTPAADNAELVRIARGRLGS